jgi:hypothetical protein
VCPRGPEVVLKAIIFEKHDFAVALWRLQTPNPDESSALEKIRSLTVLPKRKCAEFGGIPKHRSRQRIHQKSVYIREVDFPNPLHRVIPTSHFLKK